MENSAFAEKIWFPYETCKTTAEEKEFVEHVQTRNEPIILKSASLTKPAQKWNAQFFRSHFDQSTTHDVMWSESKRFMYSKDSVGSGSVKMTLAQFLDQVAVKNGELGNDETMKVGDKFYYFQNELDSRDNAPAIMDDYLAFDWQFLNKVSKNWMCLTRNIMFLNGVVDTITPVHFDEQHNIYSQIRGKKRFYLWPCSQYQNLYPYPLHHKHDRQCQVNLQKPDFHKYPKLKNLAKCHVCDLEPGDILYIPNYWFHEVHTTGVDESDSLNVSMNFWYPHDSSKDVVPDVKNGGQFSAKEYVCITRNIEKMIGQVVANPEDGDVGRFLKMVQAGRYDGSGEDFEMFDKAEITLKKEI